LQNNFDLARQAQLNSMMNMDKNKMNKNPGTTTSNGGTTSTGNDILSMLRNEIMSFMDGSVRALAVIRSQSDTMVLGYVVFSQTDSSAVRVRGRIYGLSDGSHGFHIHTNGDCSNRSYLFISLLRFCVVFVFPVCRSPFADLVLFT
jgi:Cu/Zn superoxide dismutase